VFFNIEIIIFLLQNAINTFYNKIYYDYWDLITNFWPGSTKWNTPFIKTISENRIPEILYCHLTDPNEKWNLSFGTLAPLELSVPLDIECQIFYSAFIF